MFLLKGSRTIDWAAEGATGPFPFVPPPPYPVGVAGVTPSMGTIAFFAWLDYLGAVGVMLFAFSVIHRKTKLDWFLLVFTPALIWSAPVASPWLGLDSRVLLVTRPSPKHLHVKLLAGMFVPLVLPRPKQVWSVCFAGVACGMTLHAALFFHGMRGYTSMTALFATVLTKMTSARGGNIPVHRSSEACTEGIQASCLRSPSLFPQRVTSSSSLWST